jgi:hypothetical protein
MIIKLHIKRVSFICIYLGAFLTVFWRDPVSKSAVLMSEHTQMQEAFYHF